MPQLKALFLDLALVLAAIAGALLLLTLGLTLAHFPALPLLAEWANGALGTRADLLISLKNACPLILTGLAAGVAFRAGVFNIGAEGQSILGSIAAVTLSTRLLISITTPTLAIPLALLAAAIAGAAWAFLAAALDRYRKVPIVLSTILLNFIALQLLGILLEGPLKTRSSDIVQSDILPAAYHLPIIATAPGGYLHLGLPIALAAALSTWFILSRTTFGFELLVTGLNPTAARLAGMPVARRQFATMLASGALAGLAGATQLLGTEGHSLSPTPVSYGYTGIAVALLGRLHPAGIVLAAFFFSALDRGADNLELSDFLLPREVADILKAVIVLLLLIAAAAIARRRSAAGGTP